MSSIFPPSSMLRHRHRRRHRHRESAIDAANASAPDVRAASTGCCSRSGCYSRWRQRVAAVVGVLLRHRLERRHESVDSGPLSTIKIHEQVCIPQRMCCRNMTTVTDCHSPSCSTDCCRSHACYSRWRQWLAAAVEVLLRHWLERSTRA